jgi:hypothetical protein
MKIYGRLKYVVLFPLLLSASLSCKHHHRHAFGAADSLKVKDTVTQLAANISRDVSAKGPLAWLSYFHDSPNFFMANNGQLVLHSHQQAKVFIQDTLVKSITQIILKWQNLRVDVLSPRIASIAADYYENLTFANGSSIPFNGYFTGIALRTPNGWKLRNAHWSVKAK